MSEEDVREGLRDAVTDEPPLNFDPDVLVSTARQRVTRRRALVAVGTATVAIAVAAVAIPASFDSGTIPAATQPPPKSSSEQRPAASDTSAPTSDVSGTDVSYTAEQLRVRGNEMRRHLEAAAPNVLSTASDIVVGKFGGEAVGEFADGQDYVNAPITFTVDGERYSIFITAWAPQALAPATVCGSTCQELGERDGGHLKLIPEETGQQKITTVYFFRADGSALQVAAYNYDMTGVPAYQPAIPVTVDQLTRLAIDPELGL
jgi:hypothetical protein